MRHPTPFPRKEQSQLASSLPRFGGFYLPGLSSDSNKLKPTQSRLLLFKSCWSSVPLTSRVCLLRSITLMYFQGHTVGQPCLLLTEHCVDKSAPISFCPILQSWGLRRSQVPQILKGTAQWRLTELGLQFDILHSLPEPPTFWPPSGSLWC